MPSKATSGAKKKPVKALSLKEMAVKEVTAKSSARKAAAAKRTTRGKENLPSMTAAPASVASSGMPSFTNTVHC